MPEFLKSPFATGPTVSPMDVLVRLVLSLVFGGAVAWVYCRTRKSHPIATSFPTTLVLLSVLIAVVTQVIGDNVARAFSLVGALSIVRFRTVVRDTQDTAYVIFAVVVGMAVGAKNPWVALLGFCIVALAAFLMMLIRPAREEEEDPDYVLSLRVGLGQDLNKLLDGQCDSHIVDRKLLSMGTGKQGIALTVIYQVRLRPGGSPDELVRILNRTEGVQSVQLERRGWEEN
ncbi:MAG TPA: DUF4956 domain-containing protein [Verrucomicrobiae bacterium]|nr:DUF4956 domain-containing protein [Verrucomicrobiae bacterium]